MRSSYALVLGLLAASVPAAAQNHFQPGQATSSAQTMVVARLELASFATANFSRGLEPASDLPSAIHENSLRFDASAVVPTTETPFALHCAFPVITHPNGKLELGAFYDFRSVENILLGLPGGGSLPAWGVTARSHLALRTPMAEESVGMSVTFRLGRAADDAPRAQGWRCLGKLIGLHESCRRS